MAIAGAIVTVLLVVFAAMIVWACAVDFFDGMRERQDKDSKPYGPEHNSDWD